MAGYICSPRLYEYKGWRFEVGYNCWPVTKSGWPYKRAGSKFYEVLEEFLALDEKTQKNYLLGGGCVRFE